ncbi:uncharacterized protein MKK02DRAFT_41464 [Dioszegia hungarica]|uniref:Pentatricopeptide repeat-containing protein n=1 Tax=Dioszegia hungarica TaxID=4972 RepID=A0AA38H2N1_9TREE|nr:uncharacterized protein MKK02DRAFT_41464 [Dioszegia hungarica]KAI9631834.1 hypothetical protein MKK02DRAFT_41464 [Dioszegia hungarica]
MTSRSTQLAAKALSSVASTSRARPTIRCAICATHHIIPSPSHKRLFTSTPPSAGVSTWFKSQRRPPAPSLEDAHADFLKALSSGSISGLRKSYDSLLGEIDLARSRGLTLDLVTERAERTLQSGEVMQAMTFLSGRSDLAALTLLKRIYGDLPKWGFPTMKKHNRTVLRGLCSAGKVEEAIQWAEGHADADLEDWRALLAGAVRHELDLAPKVEERLKAQAEKDGKKLSSADYTLLLRHLRFDMPEDSTARRRLRQLFAETKERGIWIQREGEVELVGIHLKLGDIGRAGKIVEAWDQGNDPILWNATLDYRIAQNSVKGVEEALEEMKKLGIEPYAKALGFLVMYQLRKDPSDILNTVDDVEVRWNAKLGSITWAEILNLVDLDQRLVLYEEVRSRGVLIDTHIAKSLIFPLCALDPPDLPAALNVYKDLVSRNPVISTSTVRARLLAIYSTLFRAYADTHTTADPDMPIMFLKDMRRSGLALSTSALTSLVIILIRASPDHYAAFNNYAHMYALDPSLIDAKAYVAIISAFIAHSTPASSFATPGYVMEMIKDMRKAGYPPSPEILTSLLSNYGHQALKSRKASSDPVYRQTKLDSLHRAITEIHNTLKLESIVTPDIPLYNALMEAYARIGAYSAAFEVWDLLVERRPHIPRDVVRQEYAPSISVILDACGRAGQLIRAKRIWSWVQRYNLAQRGGKVEEGWIECLCRLGQIEEAAQVALEGGYKEQLRILLKFSWNDKEVYRTLPGRIKEKWPGMWEEVRSAATVSRSWKADED